jgi:hypothetical protein
MSADRPSDRSDDDRMLGELRLLVGDVDPVPAEVTAFARDALGWRRVDAELAELLADSALEPESVAATRSGLARARSVTFKASDLEIDLEVQHRDPGVLILGQLAPAEPGEIEVQRDDSSVARTVDADELGRFRIELAEGGRIRLRVGRESRPPIETSWITV